MKKRFQAAFPLILIFFVLLFTFGVFGTKMPWKYAWTSVFVLPLFYTVTSNLSFKRKLQGSIWPIALMLYFDYSIYSGLWAQSLVILVIAVLLSSLLETRVDVSSLFTLGIILVYLFLGLTKHLWHPGWIIFFLIPIFNILFPNHLFVRNKKEKKISYVHVYFHHVEGNVDLTLPQDQIEKILNDIEDNYDHILQKANISIPDIMKNLKKKEEYSFDYKNNIFVFSVKKQ